MRSNLYFLYGEEPYLIDERIKQIALELGEGVFMEKLEAKEAAGKLGELLGARSLFAEKRVLVIKDQKVFSDKRLADQIPEILSSIAPTEKVVFVYAGIPDGPKKLISWLKKKGQVEEFRSFAPWQEEEALAFITREARKNGKKIASHAAQIFWEMAGSDLAHLSSEIDKVSTFAGEKETIEKTDVLAVISAGEVDVFDFVNSLKSKNTKEAFGTLNRLLKEKEDPAQVLGLLASQFRMLLQVKSLESLGRDNFQISRELKAKPFFVKKTLEKTGNFSLEGLKDVLGSILEADCRIKTGYSSEAVIGDLVLSICRP